MTLKSRSKVNQRSTTLP